MPAQLPTLNIAENGKVRILFVMLKLVASMLQAKEPISKTTRNLTALEAIFGQLYLAVLIARLVGQSQQDKKRDE